MKRTAKILTILIIVVAVTALVFTTMQVSGLVYSNNFETGTLEFGVATSGGGTGTISTSNPKSGTYCVHFNCPATGKAHGRIDDFGSMTSIFVEASFRFPSAPSSGYIRLFEILLGEPLTRIAELTVQGQTLVLSDRYGGKSDSTSVSIQANTYYTIVVGYQQGSSGGFWGYINGVMKTSISTNTATYPAANRVHMGIAYCSGAQEVFMDDLKIGSTMSGVPTYGLSVSSSPVTGASVTVDGGAVGVTPYSGQIAEGTHTVGVSNTVTSGGNTYTFTSWSDQSTANPRSVTVTGPVSLTANYEMEPPESDTGTVNLWAYDRTSGSYVTIDTTVTDPSGATHSVSVPSTGYVWSDATLGTWTLSGSYGTVEPTSDTDSGTLNAGETLVLRLLFGVGEEPPIIEPIYDLTLTVDKTAGFTGETFMVSGQLTKDGEGLENGMVNVYCDGELLHSARTDSSGIYSLSWIGTQGTHVFSAEAPTYGVTSDSVTVTVSSPGEARVAEYSPLLIVGIGAVAVVGLLVATKLRRKD